MGVTDRSRYGSLFKWFFAAACFSLPLAVAHIHAKILILLGLVWLMARPKFSLGRSRLLFALFVLQFICVLVGIAYSENLTASGKFLETSVALVALPLFLFSHPDAYEEKWITHMLIAFVSGVVALNLLSLFFISYDVWDSRNLQTSLIEANRFIVNIHPAFLSMYISLSVFILVDLYFPLRGHSRQKIGWVLFALTVLIVFLIWLNSRAGIAAFVCGAMYFIISRHHLRRVWGLGALGIFLILLFLIPFSRERFLTAPARILSNDAAIRSTDPNVYPMENRLAILKCNMDLLTWPTILYGYGTGDSRDELQKCFKTNNYAVPRESEMDAHNEYFAQIHRHGISGLISFVALLIVPLLYAYRTKNALLGSFIVTFGCVAMFENVFSAQKGLSFFALLCPLLWLLAMARGNGQGSN